MIRISFVGYIAVFLSHFRSASYFFLLNDSHLKWTLIVSRCVVCNQTTNANFSKYVNICSLTTYEYKQQKIRPIPPCVYMNSCQMQPKVDNEWMIRILCERKYKRTHTHDVAYESRIFRPKQLNTHAIYTYIWHAKYAICMLRRNIPVYKYTPVELYFHVFSIVPLAHWIRWWRRI